MRELSLHILDIAENGITAGADCIQIWINEDRGQQNILTIAIEDNGRGMPAEKLEKPTDPFITTRTTRRVGLGLSLLAAAADRCEGKLKIKPLISHEYPLDEAPEACERIIQNPEEVLAVILKP